ncbi:MAG: hypothetical protein HQ592_12075 [Planctomycetes bacterium]|nr:hypothetical protein [Planctomycetota bacterium]
MAYQLIWALSVFWRTAPVADDWLGELNQATERDHIRILKHRFQNAQLSHFLISTRPQVPPVEIAKSVKGRLQYLIRDRFPKPFKRNYSLQSVGSTRREKLEQYLASQVEHHSMADPCTQQRLARYQIQQADVDLSAPQHTTHAIYWHNLHVVMVNEGRWMEMHDDVMKRLQGMVLKASRLKGHRLSRAGILPDHVHLTLGCSLEESPLEVALSYMNNVVFACDMKPVLKFSCYVGTFGEYDLGAVL